MMCPISFSKFSDGLPVFACARPTGNLRSIGFGVNILSQVQLETLPTGAKSMKRVFPCVEFNRFILLLEALTTNFRPS